MPLTEVPLEPATTMLSPDAKSGEDLTCQAFCTRGNWVRHRVDYDAGRQRGLVCGRDAGEILDLSPSGFGIETFRVTALARCKIRLDVDLEEITFTDGCLRVLAVGCVR